MTITLTVSDARRVKAVGPALTSPEAVTKAAAHLKDLAQEHLVCFTLNARGHVITCHTVSIGTADASLLHPRDVFRAAVADNASGVILVHNHPSGDPAPSPTDIAVTRRVAEAGKLLGIPLLDHLIVATEGFRSLRDHICP